jgi:hypothetical protein
MTTIPPASNGPGIGQRVDRIGSDAQQLWEDTRSMATQLNDSLDLKGRVERHPYGTLLAALGVGYVLGGGLFTPLTASLLRLGVRLAALPFVKDELLSMAEQAVRGYHEGRAAGAAPPSTTPAPEGSPAHGQPA